MDLMMSLNFADRMGQLKSKVAMSDGHVRQKSGIPLGE